MVCEPSRDGYGQHERVGSGPETARAVTEEKRPAPSGRPARRLTAHALRHTAASLAISAGANVKAVQRMLGHASAAMTLDVYADLFDSDLDTVADRLDELHLQATAR